MAQHLWPLDEFGEIDEYVVEWNDGECHGPQCAACNAVICVPCVDDPEALADQVFADCPEA